MYVLIYSKNNKKIKITNDFLYNLFNKVKNNQIFIIQLITNMYIFYKKKKKKIIFRMQQELELTVQVILSFEYYRY